jgi:hypothetical protein
MSALRRLADWLARQLPQQSRACGRCLREPTTEGGPFLRCRECHDPTCRHCAVQGTRENPLCMDCHGAPYEDLRASRTAELA